MIEHIGTKTEKPMSTKPSVNQNLAAFFWFLVIIFVIGAIALNVYTEKRNACVVNLMQYDNTTAAEAKEACK